LDIPNLQPKLVKSNPLIATGDGATHYPVYDIGTYRLRHGALAAAIKLRELRAEGRRQRQTFRRGAECWRRVSRSARRRRHGRHQKIDKHEGSQIMDSETRSMKRKARTAAVIDPELLDDDVLNTPPPSEEMETVIVSPRGVIWGPHPTLRRVVRLGEDGKPVYAPKILIYRENCAITLPVSEVERFIKMGRVHRPGEVPPHPDLVLPQNEGSSDGPLQEHRGGVYELDESGNIKR